MMDFRLKKLKPGHTGLNMCLCPGIYKGVESRADSIHIAEDPFWFLEIGIKTHCTPYARPFAHYGVTEIPRKAWCEILGEWDALGKSLDAASLTTDLPVLRLVMKDVRKTFVKDFKRNCAGLSKLIEQLTDWMRAELAAQEYISVHGI
jgi:hypothetical protein